jgi:hypothetical protein
MSDECSSPLAVLVDRPAAAWPPDARDRLRAALADLAAPLAQRLRAIDLTGELDDLGPALARALVAVLRDAAAPVELRARAAIALGPVLEAAHEAAGADDDDDDDDDEGTGPGAAPASTLDDDTRAAVQQALGEVHADPAAPVLVRRRALEAAVRWPAGWQVAAVAAAQRSGDPDWALTAVFCAGYLPGCEDAILAALTAEDPDLRFEAVRAAGRQELTAAWPAVAAILRAAGPDRELLLAAIEAAPWLRPREASKLLRRLAGRGDAELAAAAAEAAATAAALGELD